MEHEAEEREIRRTKRRAKKKRPTMKVSGRGTKKLAHRLSTS
ncbi:MAG: hypothetical protein AAB337_00180 [Patescibacteria group bacterium]